MGCRPHRLTTRSPLIRPGDPAAHEALPAPSPHTGAELAALIALLSARRPRVRTVSVGHSRDGASRAAALAFAGAWSAVAGRSVLAVADWPENAASWLRPARRLAAAAPDAWVIAAAGPGWAQMARRLAHSTDWDPRRTFGFASLGCPRIAALAGWNTLDGMCGASAEGGTWEIGGGSLTCFPPGRDREVPW